MNEAEQQRNRWRNAASALWEVFLNEPWSMDPTHRARQDRALELYEKALNGDEPRKVAS